MDAKSLIMDWNVESDDRVWGCRKSIREKRTAIAMAAAVITTVAVATALYVKDGANVTEDGANVTEVKITEAAPTNQFWMAKRAIDAETEVWTNELTDGLFKEGEEFVIILAPEALEQATPRNGSKAKEADKKDKCKEKSEREVCNDKGCFKGIVVDDDCEGGCRMTPAKKKCWGTAIFIKACNRVKTATACQAFCCSRIHNRKKGYYAEIGMKEEMSLSELADIKINPAKTAVVNYLTCKNVKLQNRNSGKEDEPQYRLDRKNCKKFNYVTHGPAKVREARREPRKRPKAPLRPYGRQKTSKGQCKWWRTWGVVGSFSTTNPLLRLPVPDLTNC